MMGFSYVISVEFLIWLGWKARKWDTQFGSQWEYQQYIVGFGYEWETGILYYIILSSLRIVLKCYKSQTH